MGHQQGAFSNHRRSSRGNWRPHVFGEKRPWIWNLGNWNYFKGTFKFLRGLVERIWVFWAYECHLELNWNWSSGQTSTKRKSANVCSFLENTRQLFRPKRIEHRGNVYSFLENTHASCSDLHEKPEKTHMSVSQTDRKKIGNVFLPFLKTHLSVIQTYTKRPEGKCLFRLSWKHTRQLFIAISSQTRVTFTWPLVVIWRFWFFVLTPFNSAPFGCIEFTGSPSRE